MFGRELGADVFKAGELLDLVRFVKSAVKKSNVQEVFNPVLLEREEDVLRITASSFGIGAKYQSVKGAGEYATTVSGMLSLVKSIKTRIFLNKGWKIAVRVESLEKVCEVLARDAMVSLSVNELNVGAFASKNVKRIGLKLKHANGHYSLGGLESCVFPSVPFGTFQVGFAIHSRDFGLLLGKVSSFNKVGKELIFASMPDGKGIEVYSGAGHFLLRVGEIPLEGVTNPFKFVFSWDSVLAMKTFAEKVLGTLRVKSYACGHVTFECDWDSRLRVCESDASDKQTRILGLLLEKGSGVQVIRVNKKALTSAFKKVLLGYESKQVKLISLKGLGNGSLSVSNKDAVLEREASGGEMSEIDLEVPVVECVGDSFHAVFVVDTLQKVLAGVKGDDLELHFFDGTLIPNANGGENAPKVYSSPMMMVREVGEGLLTSCWFTLSKISGETE